MQITSLLLIRKIQIGSLRVIVLGEVETATKSWFAVVGLNDPIWTCYFFLNSVIVLIYLSMLLKNGICRIPKVI